MRDKLTINVDVDGVVYDFTTPMLSLAEHYLERKLPPADDWNVWRNWGITKAEWLEMFSRMAREDEVFRTGAEIPGAVDAIMELRAAGHRVRFVTSKSLPDPRATLAARLQCTRWLAERELLQGTELCFVNGDKSGYQADVVIDDKPTLDWRQYSALNLLFDQPWNQPETLRGREYAPLMFRAMDWNHVLTMIEMRGG